MGSNSQHLAVLLLRAHGIPGFFCQLCCGLNDFGVCGCRANQSQWTLAEPVWVFFFVVAAPILPAACHQVDDGIHGHGLCIAVMGRMADNFQ